QPDDLAEGEKRPEQQDADDEAVQARIGVKGRLDLLFEDQDDESDDDQERRHSDQEYAGRGEGPDFGFDRHALWAVSHQHARRTLSEIAPAAPRAESGGPPAKTERRRGDERRLSGNSCHGAALWPRFVAEIVAE